MSEEVMSFGDERSEGSIDGGDNPASPNRGQFRPGQSGNPKGRPKRKQKQQSAIDSALDEEVTIKDSKGTRRVSVKQVIAKRLVQKAMGGDISALKVLQSERPDFLKEIINKKIYNLTFKDFVIHIASVMTESAVMEFRAALDTWEERWRQCQRGDRGESEGSQ